MQQSDAVHARCWELICGWRPVSCRAARGLSAAEGAGPGRAVQPGECIAANSLLHRGQLHPAGRICTVPLLQALQQLRSADAPPCTQQGSVQLAGGTQGGARTQKKMCRQDRGGAPDSADSGLTACR